MGKISEALTHGLTIRESATDGSDFTNPAADYRRLFLGEDGALHLKDSAGAVTAVGGGGALVLLEQHTGAASATLDFTTCISSTYDEYQIEIVNLVPATDDVTLYMRMGTGGGPTFDSGNNYGWQFIQYRAASGPYLTGAEGGAAFIKTGNGPGGTVGVSNNANWGVCGSLKLYSPGSAMYKRVIGEQHHLDAEPYRVGVRFEGSYESATAVTAFQFFFSTGNIASGTIRAYGVAK